MSCVACKVAVVSTRCSEKVCICVPEEGADRVLELSILSRSELKLERSPALPLGVGRLLGAKPGTPGLVAFVTQGCMAACLGKDKLVELIQWSGGSHINIIMSKNQGETESKILHWN